MNEVVGCVTNMSSSLDKKMFWEIKNKEWNFRSDANYCRTASEQNQYLRVMCLIYLQLLGMNSYELRMKPFIVLSDHPVVHYWHFWIGNDF